MISGKKTVPDINQSGIDNLPSQLKKIREIDSICAGMSLDDMNCLGEVLCSNCLFQRKHKDKGVEYLLSKGYITKADALEYTLRLSK